MIRNVINGLASSYLSLLLFRNPLILVLIALLEVGAKPLGIPKPSSLLKMDSNNLQKEGAFLLITLLMNGLMKNSGKYLAFFKKTK